MNDLIFQLQALDTGWILVLAEMMFRGLILMAGVAAMVAFMKHSAPSLRYSLWVAGIVGLLLLPVATWMLPSWDVAILPATEVEAPTMAEAPVASLETPYAEEAVVVPVPPDAPVPAAASLPVAEEAGFDLGAIHWSVWLGLIWFAGLVFHLVRLLISHVGVQYLVRRARPVYDAEWKQLLRESSAIIGLEREPVLLKSELALVPLNAGLLSSIILIPESADDWTSEKKRTVLLHELAHVKRQDCLTQFLTQLACAVYWVNPFAWQAARRMVSDREQAADDAVLLAGTKASVYANTLLETAQKYRNVDRLATATLAMARPSQLENRMLAILDPSRSREETTLINRVVSWTLVFAIAIPVMAFQPVQDPPVEPDVATAPVATTLSPDRPVAAPAPAELPANPAPVVIPIPPSGQNLAAVPNPMPLPRSGQAPAMVDGQFAEPMLDSSEACCPAQSGQHAHYDDHDSALESTPVDSLTIEQMIQLRKYGVTADLIRELKALGYQKPTYSELAGIAKQGVDPAYIKAMSAAGFSNLDLDEYTRARKYGVSGSWAQELMGAGLNTQDLDGLIQLRKYGVSPEMVESLRDAGMTDLSVEEIGRLGRYGVNANTISGFAEVGFNNLSTDDLANAAKHGVTPGFAAEMRRSGYENLSLADLTSFRRYGVSADLVGSLTNAGYDNLSAENVVRMARYGVNPNLISTVGEMGYRNVSIDDMVSFARHGVNARYLRDLKGLGMGDVSASDLIDMRKHDVTARFVKEIRDAGLTNATVEQIVDLRRKGVDADFIRSLREN